MFADDWAIIIQCKTFEEAQLILEEDLKTIDKYFKSYNLLLNPSKTEVCAFHLNNIEAERKLEINFVSSGTLKETPIPWLHVLCNIPFGDLLRK